MNDLLTPEIVESPVSTVFRATLFFGILIAALFLESRRPLRTPTQNKLKRGLINLGVAAVGAITLRFSLYPIVLGIAIFAETNQIGVMHFLSISAPLKIALSILVLDWTFYYWHWLLHKIPLLWRFHNAHHVDLDLDTTTAIRFHFGELAFSTLYRSMQIFVFGISPFILLLFEVLVTTCAQFHHSNIRLHPGFERTLGRIIVTPRLHGIHHSVVREETDSNFGTILTVWDRLHRTFKSNIPQNLIVIGVPSYRDERELGFIGTLMIPFQRQRAWRNPGGDEPDRKL